MNSVQIIIVYRSISSALRNLRNVRNTHGGVLLLAKLQAKLTKISTSTCNFTKSSTSPWLSFTFFKLCKWYQIAQRTRNTYYDFCCSANMLNIRLRGFDLAHYCISRYMVKYVNGYKGEFKPCQRSEMELFSQVVTSFRGKQGILPNIQDQAFCKNSESQKLFAIFAKTFILGV